MAFKDFPDKLANINVTVTNLHDVITKTNMANRKPSSNNFRVWKYVNNLQSQLKVYHNSVKGMSGQAQKAT